MKKIGTITLFLCLLAFPSLLHAGHPLHRLMELYDPNTELILEGKALKELKGENLVQGRPDVLPLSMGKRTLFVIMGPPWYTRKLGLSLEKGQRVRVIGSKVYGPDGRLYIIARKIVILKGGEFKTYLFRDRRYVPFWWGVGRRGRRRHRW